MIFLSFFKVLPDYDVTHHFLHEVKKRHENFLKMEQTIEELRDLFFDLALIVQVDVSEFFNTDFIILISITIY